MCLVMSDPGIAVDKDPAGFKKDVEKMWETLSEASTDGADSSNRWTLAMEEMGAFSRSSSDDSHSDQLPDEEEAGYYTEASTSGDDSNRFPDMLASIPWALPSTFSAGSLSHWDSTSGDMGAFSHFSSTDSLSHQFQDEEEPAYYTEVSMSIDDSNRFPDMLTSIPWALPSTFSAASAWGDKGALSWVSSDESVSHQFQEEQEPEYFAEASMPN